MCGIAGLWERSGKPVDRRALERMSELLVHRGPDGAGVHVEGSVGFANRRLRIVDVSPAADQPLTLPERGLALTYNGEIHNYVELRRELEASGARFRTQTDTEVVLHAYAEWGRDCFERFNGMWALVLWDAHAEELVLSRDRFGIKPLVYSVRGERIAFASEPKAILAACPEEREPDLDEIDRFIAGGFTDVGSATFLANVRAVEPAQTLVFRRDGCSASSYWQFEPGLEEPRPGVEEEFRELLRDAVRLRMRSDVPVGACLSGGLDSSAIVRLMPPTDEPVHCFSLRYDDPSVDESAYAALAARDRNVELHWVRPDPSDLVATVRRIVWHHDAPMPVRGRLPQWFVMQEAGRHVKVVLDGQGGDELLAGYSRYVFPYLRDRLRLGPQRRGMLGELPRLGELESRSRLWFLARTPLPPLQRALGLPPWVRGTARAAGTRRPQSQAIARPYRSALNNALWHELRHEGLPEVLHAEDALSMAFSVESRTPFLDHRLVELCFSLPFHEKMAGGLTKSLLRRALAADVPPEILARRRKLGFSAPLGHWLRDEATWQDVRGLLLDPRSLERGFFDPRLLERELAAFPGASPFTLTGRVGRIWRWMTLELWFRDFVDPPPADGSRGVNGLGA